MEKTKSVGFRPNLFIMIVAVVLIVGGVLFYPGDGEIPDIVIGLALAAVTGLLALGTTLVKPDESPQIEELKRQVNERDQELSEIRFRLRAAEAASPMVSMPMEAYQATLAGNGERQ